MGKPGGQGGGREAGAARTDGAVLSRQLHVSEVVAERGPELRSAPEQSPLEEFLATAELAGTRFVAGERLGRARGCGWAGGRSGSWGGDPGLEIRGRTTPVLG